MWVGCSRSGRCSASGTPSWVAAEEQGQEGWVLHSPTRQGGASGHTKQGSPLHVSLLCPIFGLNQAERPTQGTANGKGAWMCVGLSGKAQFQLPKQLPVSMRMWLPCLLGHRVADPKSGEACARRQQGQWSTPPQGAHKRLQSLSDLIILCKNVYGYS